MPTKKPTLAQLLVKGAKFKFTKDFDLPVATEHQDHVGSYIFRGLTIAHKKLPVKEGDTFTVRDKSKVRQVSTAEMKDYPAGRRPVRKDMKMTPIELSSGQKCWVPQKELTGRVENVSRPEVWTYRIRIKKTGQWYVQQQWQTAGIFVHETQAKDWKHMGHVKNHLRMITGQIEGDEVPEWMESQGPSVPAEVLDQMEIVKYEKFSGKVEPVETNVKNYVLTAKLKRGAPA